MPPSGGLRAKSIVYAFPFYEKNGSKEDEQKRAQIVTDALNKLSFVRNAFVDFEKLRDPLIIEVNPQNHKLQDRSIGEIENGLSHLILKLYNYKDCL